MVLAFHIQSLQYLLLPLHVLLVFGMRQLLLPYLELFFSIETPPHSIIAFFQYQNTDNHPKDIKVIELLSPFPLLHSFLELHSLLALHSFHSIDPFQYSDQLAESGRLYHNLIQQKIGWAG